MAVGGGVYQPTTVTYEQGAQGGGGLRCLDCLRCPPRAPCRGAHRWSPWLVPAALAVATLICLPLGLKLLVDGALGAIVVSILIGVLFTLVGAASLGFLLRIWLRRRGGWPEGKQGIEAGGGVAGAALGAPNPSTDPLVAAQYAPVRDAPPADDERRQLMDNKECLSSAEESDRMLEPDPRIVLRPLKSADDA